MHSRGNVDDILWSAIKSKHMKYFSNMPNIKCVFSGVFWKLKFLIESIKLYHVYIATTVHFWYDVGRTTKATQ